MTPACMSLIMFGLIIVGCYFGIGHIPTGFSHRTQVNGGVGIILYSTCCIIPYIIPVSISFSIFFSI